MINLKLVSLLAMVCGSSLALSRERHLAQRARSEATQAIPVEITVPNPPIPVRAGGKWHMLYELHLTSFSSKELYLERISVAGADSKSLGSWEGDILAGVLTHPGSGPGNDSRRLLPGTRAVAFVEVITAANSPPPPLLLHSLMFKPVRTLNGLDETQLVGPRFSISRERAVPVGPPLAGGCWIASHGLANNSSHRRTLITVNGASRISQRFAIDWIRVGPDGLAFRGDPAMNGNWTPYGANVLAVADGRVLEVHDGVPENSPTAETKAVPITLRTVGGNSVLLDIGRGLSVFYAHLQPGSIHVRVGSMVHRGEVVGRIGNSGQSDAPHLHMHIVKGQFALAGEGVPLEFDQFAVMGHLASLQSLADGVAWRPTGRPKAVKAEMPVENAVVQFPGGNSACALSKIRR